MESNKLRTREKDNSWYDVIFVVLISTVSGFGMLFIYIIISGFPVFISIILSLMFSSCLGSYLTIMKIKENK